MKGTCIYSGEPCVNSFRGGCKSRGVQFLVHLNFGGEHLFENVSRRVDITTSHEQQICSHSLILFSCIETQLSGEYLQILFH